ncbi:BR-serine/threonine kinase-like protein (nucleomorph) [Cryptomonas paramecium]|uniref:BR-serine/threonine kinase-like protein n=1 Tax=Cryptomonas paramaecium TaxID=2898 RepID=F2HHN6_9CRYP|nr:BR-serine/threonine kinase-like protein [Cryptomonas paramecium]AEA38832.1 BR-serine/threonine kinase-like protein [Cryptomonas paramecium]
MNTVSTDDRYLHKKFIGPYILKKTLGIGAIGKVKLAYHSKTNKKVSVKIIRKILFSKKPDLKIKIHREISVMKLMFHPHIIKIFDVLEDSTYLFLVIEYASHGELFNYLVKKGQLHNREALCFFQQIVSGIEYCHRYRICHRDLKLENILLDKIQTIKIADFGMASLNVSNELLKTFCGSPHYASPEVFSNEPYDGMKADIWSCGVILYALLTGKLPFDEENDNMKRLFNKIRFESLSIPDTIFPECKDLLLSIFIIDPSKRITLFKIKTSLWYKSLPLRRTCRNNFLENIHVTTIQNPVFIPDPDIIKFLVPLRLVSDQSVLIKVLCAKEPNLVRILYRQLEWRKMKMDSLQNDIIYKAIKRRKKLLKKKVYIKKKEIHSKIEIWKQPYKFKNYVVVKLLIKITISFFFSLDGITLCPLTSCCFIT